VNLDDYQAPRPQVEAVHSYWLEAFVGDAVPRPGEALAIFSGDGQTVYAEVVALSGARRVQAVLAAMPEWMEVGLEVRRTSKPVGFCVPESGRLELTAALFVPHEAGQSIALRGQRPPMMMLDGRRPVLETGIAGVDRFCPLACRGFNLVVDLSSGRQGWERLVRVAQEGLREAATIVVGADSNTEDFVVVAPREVPGQVMALRIGMRWAASLRDGGKSVGFFGELPNLETSSGGRGPSAAVPGMGELIELMGDVLVSTHEASVTSLMRLDLGAHKDGLGQIIETMHLGAVDSQIIIEPNGRLDLSRSTSRAEVDADLQEAAVQMLSRAHRVRERHELLGEDDLEPGDLAFLEEMASLARL
jgi:hypothetical protein